MYNRGLESTCFFCVKFQKERWLKWRKRKDRKRCWSK
nr:MAG TPA: hypothetical protein [Caudoviricetes sp.]